MLVVALLLATLAAIVTVVMGVSAGHVGLAAPLWGNVVVLVPSALAVAGGIACLQHPTAATYLLCAAVLIFGLAENWTGLALCVAAGAIEFHFGPAPKT